MPHTYCFPFRAESIDVLRNAMKVNSADARAPYYLGNLLYEQQPENAVIEWEKSRALDSDFYIVHRNLGIAYEEVQNDISKAIISMEKAAQCNSTDPRLLYELDVLYEKNKVAPQKRYAFLRNNFESVKKRSEALLRAAMTSVQVGKYNEALEILGSDGFVADQLRVRAFPFADSIKEFIDSHEQIFVIEQNRDAQMRTLLVNELDVNPEKLVPVLYYGGMPITAQTIADGIRDNRDDNLMSSIRPNIKSVEAK